MFFNNQNETPLCQQNANTYADPEIAAFYASEDALQPSEQLILERIGPQVQGQKILDIGVGGGRTTGHLLKLSTDYLGVDYSAEMVAACRNRYPSVAFMEADARNLSALESGRYQLILFSFNGIDYVPQADRLQILSEIHRLLSPGGIFVFSTHNRDAYKSHIEWTPHPLKLSARIVRYVRGHWTRLQMRSMEIQAETYAILNDEAHDYRLMTYYIRKTHQIEQLRQVGFTGPLWIYNETGEEDPTTANNQSPWLYFCVSKT